MTVEHHPVLRSALFLDFDNIYLGLAQGGVGGEEEFARNPIRWLRWLEGSLDSAPPVRSVRGSREPSDRPREPLGDRRRRILIRRCYLNPKSFHWSRPFFIRAGFEVVDTPALTAQGKTSTDIQMALDMVDTLSHTTRFDEFILFSGDADFTPVLRRLREHDRHTIVLATGPTAAAYRSVCDQVVDEERFVEQALGITGEEGAATGQRAPSEPPDELLRRIAARVEELAAMTGGIQPVHLPAIYKEFREFSEGENWLGTFSLRAMTDAVVAASDRLVIFGEDPWWVGQTERTERDEGGEDGLVAEPTDVTPPGIELPEDERARLAEFVRHTVERSDRPLGLATVAHLAVQEFGDDLRAFNWRGAGSFKAFLEHLDLEPIRISEAETGAVFDPERHADPAEREGRDLFAEERPELARLAESVHELTDTPYLAPEHYATVLTETAREVEANGFHMTRTSKAVRDRCYGRGIMVPRSAISFLLKGLSYSGYPLRDPGPHTARRLGEAVAENTITLCRRAQMEIGPEQEAQIRSWIAGSLPDEDDDTDRGYEGETYEDQAYEGDEAGEDDEEETEEAPPAVARDVVGEPH